PVNERRLGDYRTPGEGATTQGRAKALSPTP
ncbi:MAG: hypothetical protein QOJ23_380, partial [Actinomycetota bacterium]|nr:hypothetical protein [Actinomycetota bacterium]